MKTSIAVGVLFAVVTLQHIELGRIMRRLSQVETTASILLAGYRVERETKEYHQSQRDTKLIP
jgi:hypothetical protein